MSKMIALPYQSDLEKLYKLGRNEALSLGGTISGNKLQGEFSVPALGGRFEGTYKVYDGLITFNLSKKPMFIPYALIETFLKKYIK
jgi:hypothetical protein